MHRLRTVALAAAILLAAAQPACHAVFFQGSFSTTGCVQRVGIEGACIVLHVSNGDIFLLIGTNLPPANVTVEVDGRLLDQPTTCQIGRPLEVRTFRVVAQSCP
jgi:hypothetical protein